MLLFTVRPRNSLSFRIIFRPDPFKLIQVMWPQYRPITGQIVKVVHDHSNKQVDDLEPEQKTISE